MIRESAFRPAPGLGNRHLQTLLPALGLVPTPTPKTRREILALPDGDSLALDWLDTNAEDAAPLLMVLHGLEGSSESSYARCLLDVAQQRGWRALVMHFRDCGDHRNRLARRYHAGETGDLAFVADRLRERYPDNRQMFAGFSLGGNVLLKYLGENREGAHCDAAVAVSVPFLLQEASDAISQGFSKLYQWHLMRNMKRALREKFAPESAPFAYEAALRTTTFEEFDNLVTAPLHGFADKDEYYRKSSSRQFLIDIAKPTLVLHAVDDPFMTTTMIPEPHELSDQVLLELSRHGGHVGFITGNRMRERRYWLPERIGAFFEEQLSAA
ncbi:MAG: hydrolase [Pseudomonadota bacterium]